MHVEIRGTTPSNLKAGPSGQLSVVATWVACFLQRLISLLSLLQERRQHHQAHHAGKDEWLSRVTNGAEVAL